MSIVLSFVAGDVVVVRLVSCPAASVYYNFLRIENEETKKLSTAHALEPESVLAG